MERLDVLRMGPQSSKPPNRRPNRGQDWYCSGCRKFHKFTKRKHRDAHNRGTDPVPNWGVADVRLGKAVVSHLEGDYCGEEIKTVQVRADILESHLEELSRLRRFRDAILNSAVVNVPDELKHTAEAAK